MEGERGTGNFNSGEDLELVHCLSSLNALNVMKSISEINFHVT